ncbi:hypothetical protein ACFY1G_00665 [Streptomyces olivaceus]|uniref:SAF domain-containing protein n=1 Tax=Streptomyces olivaceus TaxID=47716 RepID=A0ABS7VWI2_STROV|nr:hypothetical protein [Streptomyces olivaceus]AOW88483.1 hypothetical protein BC342_20340 [Streptomyces olivaceus]MBZ6086838.1 hypothetical protein [Streptomyces olivaceus]MBZ6094561.1 hypothetical protein [Streptomyces olivaceus]MBZ6115677.1 hypothetical protein [Streptomyces olivaceus]MBZ6149682.1 hypothetical protein [Streptomyces olivaceus]
MKIQERTGAGAGRSASPAQPPVGDRLPSPPRERKPALAALAVLLILVGALGVTTLVVRVGDRVEVVKVTKDIPPGGRITDQNSAIVMVADDPGINYIKESQLSTIKGYKTVTMIPGGTLPVGEMFAKEPKAPAGKASVGLALKEGQYYADIKGGDEVAAYRVGSKGSGGSDSGDEGSSSSSASSALLTNASVENVKKDSDATVSTGSISITLLVDEEDAAAVASAASAGEVAVVRVPTE